jgi:hypothetical protein
MCVLSVYMYVRKVMPVQPHMCTHTESSDDLDVHHVASESQKK